MWRLPSPSGDRGSIPLAMMVVVVGSMIGALVGTLVLSQFAATRVDLRRVHALHAAQAGLDVASAHIRAIASASGSDRTKLPCGPLTGSLGGGSTAVYRVTVRYYLSDPQNRAEDWLTTNKVRCNASSGLGVVPAYAYLVSTGADQPTTTFTDVPTRVLNGTYTFKIDNTNVVGGLIHVSNNGGADLCMDAGSGTPPQDRVLEMQRCEPGKVSQMFAYNDNLTISLVSSRSGSEPLGMCLDVDSVTDGKPVVFRSCASPTRQSQRWSFDDNSQFRPTNSNGTMNTSLCIYVLTARSVGSQVSIKPCSGDATQIVFRQDSGVGAGAAGATTGQLINYRQFGRCLDVTNAVDNAPYLIAWPCKTRPNQADVKWNQRFTLPTVPNGPHSEMSTNHSQVGVIRSGSNNNYCMSSPGSTTTGAYVRFNIACPVGPIPRNQQWTVYGKTDSYSTSYQIKDGWGYCLQPQDQNAANPDYFNATNKVMKIFVGPCDGSTLQKWNAEVNKLDPVRLKDVNEK
ncbi:ricin-type beta-trefoil lectin domain protein [Catenuloplanes atrovinosus]|nr:ricin-type beta-trefoil lectin domain protein [Catenuloplanes atrovinosus]